MAPSSSRGGDVTQESHSEDCESQGEEYDVSGNSGGEQVVAEQAAAEPPKWPLIQIVDPPPWLPPGWTAVLRTRENGAKDKYYVDPQSGRRFRSKTEVNYYLETGKSYRYKRKMNDAGLGPPTTSGKGISTGLPNGIPYADHKINSASQMRCSVPGNLRTGGAAFRADSNFGNEIIPGSRTGTMLEDGGRRFASSSDKKSASKDIRVPESFLGFENKGKLILKLKRKTADADDGWKSLKKPRPFEVVGPSACMVQAAQTKMISRKNQWAVGCTSFQAKMRTNSRENQRATNLAHELCRVPMTLPAGLGSRKPLGKASQSASLYRPHSNNQGYPGSGGLQHQNNSNGLERASGSASMSITDSENIKASQKESPSQQLQRLGKRLCRHALTVLTRDFGGNGSHMGSAGFHSADHSNGCFNTTKESYQSPAQATARAQAAVRPTRDGFQKRQSVEPLRRRWGALEHPYMQMQMPQPV